MQSIQNPSLFSLYFRDRARFVGMDFIQRQKVLRLFWVFVLLLGVRGWVNCFLLEPYNDEGLWLWNARCLTWNLPDGGILHAALSPVTFYFYSVIFRLLPVSGIAVRVVQWTLLYGTILMALRFLLHRQLILGAWLFLGWLLLDPTFFRVGSWAILEPLLCAAVLGIFLWFKNQNETGGETSPYLWGLVLGFLLAVKLTMVWLVLGWVGFEILRKQWKRAILIPMTALGVSSLFYFSIYQMFDKSRFWEIWHLHSAINRLTFFSPDVFPPLVRHYLPHYLVVITLIVSLVFLLVKALRDRSRLNPFVIGSVIGVILLFTQAYSPTRYYLPVMMLTIFQSALWIPETGLRIKSKLAFLVVAIVIANVGEVREYILRPKNFGGRTLKETVGQAVKKGFTVAAPPMLALSFRYAIEPTSVGPLANRPQRKFLPDLYIYQGVAAQPTRLDRTFIAELEKEHFDPVEVGQFQVFAIKERRLAKSK